MSVGYGGEGETLVYETTAEFDFTTTQPDPLYLTLVNFDATGDGFDSLESIVSDNMDANAPPLDVTFTSLRSAETFFLDNKIDLGFGGVGPQIVDISLLLTASHPEDGFGFSYTVTVPEAPTWAICWQASRDLDLRPSFGSSVLDWPKRGPRKRAAG